MDRFSVSRLLLKSIGCYYIHLDLDLNIIAASVDRSNLPATAFETGTCILDYFDNRTHEQIKSVFKSLRQGLESICELEAPMVFGQKELGCKWQICSTRNADKIITGYQLAGVLSPTSNLKQLTEKNNTNSFFDKEAHPFFSFDFSGNIITANKAFLDLLEYATEELVATSFLSLADTDNPSVLKNVLANAVKGIPQDFGCTLIGKKGKKVSVNIITTPSIKNSVFVGVNAFTREIKQKEHVEKGLGKDEKRLKLVLLKLKKILDSSADIICSINENGEFTYVSAACQAILGYQPKELIGKSYKEFVVPDDLERSREATVHIKNGIGTTNFENRFYKKDGSIAYLIWSSRWEENEKRFYSIARDATEKKLSEQNLKASEEKYRVLFYNHSIAGWIYDVDTLKFIEVNDAAIKQYGYSREEFLSKSLIDILADKEVEGYKTFSKQDDFYKQNHKGLWMHKNKKGEVFYAEISSSPISYPERKVKLVLSIDRTEQTTAEQQLRKSNELFIFLSQATFDAIWDWDLESDEITWNEGIVKMFDLADPAETKKIDWWYANLHPEDRERVETKIKYHLENHVPHWEDEYRMKAGSSYKYIYDRGYIIYNDQNKPVRMIGAMQDLTERKEHEIMLQNLNNSLEKRAKELAESNAELERFAYVTSHDLQEPLRMVTSFLQLLERRYKDKLDKKAHEYINYAVDGAERMKRLILDLLEYSRVNSSKAEMEEVDINEIVKDVKLTYTNFLTETKGTINNKKLPCVRGNKTQLLQLFQNIIGNACKYRGSLPPLIDIAFEDEKLYYKFSISDNGIGIDPKFFHKIFIIFQRLHNRDEYSGTGIGLAICKKIVDKHGGRIWVSSTPGHGSTFYFTLPKSK
ncbi:MAG: PAS domain S-box protein [Bacteroidota bacterium]|nr:PAS domain S-box protein [Bacteroidota bacterium]